MTKDNIKIIIVSVLFVLVFAAGLFTLYYIEKQEKANYEKDYSDNIELFENYNKDNIITDGENEYVIVSIKVKQENIQKADVAIRNYLSNVNGELLSEKEIVDSKLAGILIGPVDTSIVYTVKLPKKSKLADSLQKSLDEYFKYVNEV